ncbi:MAG: hypothetical protein EOO17_02575 [Chloroflexi bacterium]|nr:MAG: hypothetical protein EOO17_02575 [Chloroflexota bacterium]
MSTSDFDLPREKLQAKGVAHLSDAEVLQLLIGSGNAANSVAHIARKAKKALQKHGSNITHDQLCSLAGIGSARAGTLLAAFELARRYPVSGGNVTLNTQQRILEFAADIRTHSDETTLYITLDGAKRPIAKRHLSTNLSHTKKLRTITSHYLSDSAASIVIVKGCIDQNIVPSLDDLQFAKELNSILAFFGTGICTHYLMNALDVHVVLGYQYG